MLGPERGLIDPSVSFGQGYGGLSDQFGSSIVRARLRVMDRVGTYDIPNSNDLGKRWNLSMFDYTIHTTPPSGIFLGFMVR